MGLNKYIGIFLFCLRFVDLSTPEVCIETHNLEPTTYYIFSPDYPNKSKESICRQKAVAPPGYQILAECSVDTDRANGNCGGAALFISTDGDLSLNNAERFCGNGNLSRTSTFESMVIAYEVPNNETDNTAQGGRFLCSLKVQEQNCECGWSFSSRIVGGKDTKLGEFPSMVGIIDISQSNDIYCGGTIISHFIILSASHCFTNVDPSDLLVVTGLVNISDGSSAAIHRVEGIAVHPNHTKWSDDIALLKTQSFITWSSIVGPACLPFDFENNDLVGEKVNLVGWGTLDFGSSQPDILQNTVVDVLSMDKCSEYFPTMSEKNFCTLGNETDACQFDSGGPVIYNYKRQFIVGVISHGLSCSGAGTNIRVSSYLDWIKRVTPNEQFCVKRL